MSKKLGYKVLFGADTSAYKREIKKAQGYNKTFKKDLGALAGALGVTFSVGAVIGFTKKSMESYDRQAKAERALLTALKGRETIQQSLIRQAQQLQRETLFGDEETIQAQALAASMGLTYDQIEKLIPAAQNLSVATGMTLDGAVKNLARTYGGLAGELGEAIPKIRELTQEEMRAGKAIDLVNELMGGQAKAAAEAGIGAITQLKNAWGDFMEEVGSKMAPFLTDIADWGKEQLTKNRPMSVKNIIAFGWEGAENLKTIQEGESYGKKLFTSLTQGIDDYEVAIENVQGAVDTFKGHLKTLEQQGKANEEQGLRYKAVIDVLTESIEELQEKTKTPAALNVPKAPGFTPVDVPWHGVTMGLPEDPFQLSNLADSFDAFIPADIMDMKLHDMRGVIEKNNKLTIQLWEAQFLNMSAIAEQGVEDMMINAFAGLGDLMSGNTNLQGFMDSILNSVGQFAQMMGSFMVTYGMTMDAFKMTFENPWAAIAIGGSLIALGTAISNAASNPPDITSGGSATYSPQAAGGSGYYNSRDAAFNANLQLGGKIIGDGKTLKVLLDNVNNELNFTT